MASSPQTPPPSLMAAPLWWGVLCPWGPQLATPDHFSRASLRGGPAGGLRRRAVQVEVGSQGSGGGISLGLPPGQGEQGLLTPTLPRVPPSPDRSPVLVPGA